MKSPSIAEKPRRAARARGYRVALALGVIFVAVLVWVSQTRIDLRPAHRAVRAGPLELRDLEGRQLSLAGLRGQVVLVNLWASWCEPCRSEIPGLTRLAHELGPRGLAVLGVNVENREPGRIAELGRELGIDYTIAIPAVPLSGTFAGEGVLPHSWLIDRQGRIRASRAGWVPESAFRRACTQLLDEE